MTPHEAAKILDLPVDATPEQIETRFNELRAKLEDKVVKAPTPGLKAKYRESLEELTAAFEQLTLAADASALPMLQRQRTEDAGPKTAKPAPDSGLRSQVSGLPPKPKASNKEFLIVAVLALAVLGAGGWWVMKTRAENAEQDRVAAESVQKAAEQKAEAERQAELARQTAEAKRLAEQQEKQRLALEEKKERDHQEKSLIALRTRLAGLNVGFEAAMRTEQSAERELTELKSQERDLERTAHHGVTLEALRLSAQVKAQDAYVRWLRDVLPGHPLRVAKAKTEELLSAKALPEAEEALGTYAAELARLQSDQAARRPDLAAIASAQKLPPVPVVKKIRPDGPQHTLAYLADRLYPYDEPSLAEVRNKILHDDLRVVLFPSLDPYRNNLPKLWADVEKQIQTNKEQEIRLRSHIGTQFPNSAELLRAIDNNQPLDDSHLNDPVIKALIMVRWQILNIREQVQQSYYYFGLNPS